MVAPITGNDVATLLQTLLAYDIQHATVAAMDGPARWDPDARVIYLDGRLDIRDYFAELAAKVAELVASNVTVLNPHRPDRSRRSS